MPNPWEIRFFVLLIMFCVVSIVAAILFSKLKAKAKSQKLPDQTDDINEKLASTNKELSTLNKNLILARDQALEASSLKSSFVANISHELRTPVTGVMGMNELLLRTDLTPYQKELASSIQEAAKSLHLIVNDILDLSKIEAGKMTLQRVLLNPPEMVR